MLVFQRAVSCAFVCLILSAPVLGQGIEFNFGALDFVYTLTNPAAGSGDVIGTIAMNENLFSEVAVTGTASSTKAFPGATLDFALTGNVIKGAVANSYTVLPTGGMTAADSTLVTKFAASFTTAAADVLLLGGTAFSFGGQLAPLGANDAILVGGVGDTWSFIGNQPAPWDPAVSLAGGRSQYTAGTFVEAHLTTAAIPSLDAFFGSGAAPGLIRTATVANLHLNVTPEPTAGILLLAGAVAVFRRRRC